MTPSSPVVRGLEQFELAVGKDQPEFLVLPALIGRAPTTSFISRWVPTDLERLQIASGADVYAIQHTWGKGFQPLLLSVGGVDQDAAAFMEATGVGEVAMNEKIAEILDKLL